MAERSLDKIDAIVEQVRSKRLYQKWIGVTNQANRLTISRIIEM